jgi:hypothetical protein
MLTGRLVLHIFNNEKSNLMPISKLLFISILLFNTLNDIPKDKTIFISPVKIPLALSANFGELRIDHFHSGVDIKTQGTSGKEIVAAASGYVYRISITPGGFGNALYLRHPSGYSTVYGHLERFTPEIDKYVKEQQYLKKTFAITLFPPKEKFAVNQGDLIAYSGNSGSSAGPHLHYEIRKSDTEVPVNPLLFEFGTGDNIEPVFEKLVIYPLGRNTLINNEHNMKRIDVAGGYGNYYIPGENAITISGPAGFGIKSFDLLNDSYNRCAVYSIELKIDSITLFKYVMDGFSFNESRYINSHIDYETYLRENIYIERTFILPNDKLSTYGNSLNNGIFNFRDDKIHHVDIELRDVHNNKSMLGFNVRSRIPVLNTVPPANDKSVTVMPYSRINRFRAEGISLSIPSGALYDTLLFTYKKNPGNPDMLSDVHYVHNKYTPLQKAYSLSIKPSQIPAGKESKILIVQMDDDFKKSSLNSTYSEGYVNAEATSFGMFFVGIDTVPPGIYANGLTSGADLSAKKDFRIRVYDDLSGIKSYEPAIDGKWALFEYDQKNNVLIYKFDPERISKGTMHSLLLKVTDNKDNTNEFKCDFIW